MIKKVKIGLIGETHMDGGPYRAPRPAPRRVVSRPEPVHQQPEQSHTVAGVEPRTEHRSVASRRHTSKEESFFKKFLIPIVTAAVILLLAAGWFTWSRMSGAHTVIDSSKYQAVFFTNGQVYFGKLHTFNDEYMKLTDVYYLQAQTTEEGDPENPQETSSNQNNVQLIKLGDEIHGPQDEMIISKNQVLFFENLKDDGRVSQSIQQHKNGN